MPTESQPRSASAQWFRCEIVTFACKVAVVTGLLLTLGVQDDLHNLHFSLHFGVLLFLNIFVLYGVASHSYARAEGESTAPLNSRKGRTRLGSKD